jgi:antitoxin (DNA-binding transcriptional repressor) of toxin-antitoxin stability system
MKTIKLSQASRPLAEYARELSEEIMLVTDAKRPVAALVPLKGVDRESLALSGHPDFLDLIARSRAQFVADQTLTLAEMKKVALRRRKANKRSERAGGKRVVVPARRPAARG